MKKKVDAVFEGGGVRGIAHVGAVAVVEEHGYEFHHVAGTSAGAIVASLVAAKFSAKEISKAMRKELKYPKLKDKSLFDRVPGLGPLVSLTFEKGLYEGDYLESWLRKKLSEKGVRTFRDLLCKQHAQDPRYRYLLQVTATDITREKLLRLPHDIADYGIDPDDLDVAQAVRMSMSIPFFYEPVVRKDRTGRKCYIVDGGVLSNFPVWLFDDCTANPAWPTFGFRLVDGDNDISGPASFAMALGKTVLAAQDPRFSEDADVDRTISIPAGFVGFTKFNLKRKELEALYQSGRTAAEDFLRNWSFSQHKKTFRGTSPPPRGTRL